VKPAKEKGERGGGQKREEKEKSAGRGKMVKHNEQKLTELVAGGNHVWGDEDGETAWFYQKAREERYGTGKKEKREGVGGGGKRRKVIDTSES